MLSSSSSHPPPPSEWAVTFGEKLGISAEFLFLLNFVNSCQFLLNKVEFCQSQKMLKNIKQCWPYLWGTFYDKPMWIEFYFLYSYISNDCKVFHGGGILSTLDWKWMKFDLFFLTYYFSLVSEMGWLNAYCSTGCQFFGKTC